MDVMDGQSLYQTVLNAERHLFLGGVFARAERDQLAAWILARQNWQQGFSFYPTAAERTRGIRLLSGEKPQTMLATNNAVEMETLRLLSLLRPRTGLIRDVPGVRSLFERAERRLSGLCYGRVCPKGECAHASISVLRYYAARGTERSGEMIGRGLEALRQARTGEGTWHSFPFYYTLLWLTELPDSLDGRVRAELAYARPRCKRLLARIRPGASGEPFAEVRAKILKDALAQGGGTACAQSPMFESSGIGMLETTSLVMG